MTGAAHDLSRLKINRDAPPAGVRRAFRTTLILAAVAMVVVTGAVLVIRRGSMVPVQVVTATLSGGGASAGAGRGVSVVANGYVVARTKASVAAKIPGRLVYAAVSSRTPEIAVLLTLGFHPRSVLASFLTESAAIAFIGGVAGGIMALPINGIVTSTTNWSSFSDVAFAFRVTPGLLLSGVIFAVVMGLVGGFFPAWRAARLQVVQALR